MNKITVRGNTEIFHTEPYNTIELEAMFESEDRDVKFLDEATNPDFVAEFKQHLENLKLSSLETTSFSFVDNICTFADNINHTEEVIQKSLKAITFFSDLTILYVPNAIWNGKDFYNTTCQTIMVIPTDNVKESVVASKALNIGEVKTSICSRKTKGSKIFGLQTHVVMYKQQCKIGNVPSRVNWSSVLGKAI